MAALLQATAALLDFTPTMPAVYFRASNPKIRRNPSVMTTFMESVVHAAPRKPRALLPRWILP